MEIAPPSEKNQENFDENSGENAEFSIAEVFNQEESDSNKWKASKIGDTDILALTTSVKVSQSEFKEANPGVDLNHIDISQTYNYITYNSQKSAGWNIKKLNQDGSIDLDKNIQINVNHSNHNNLIETSGNVSQQHIQQVQEKISSIPENVRNFLQKAGYKVIIAPSIIAALPELKGQKYRGWNLSFEYSDGTHDAEKKLIIAPEKVKEQNREKNTEEWVPVDRPNVVTHQFGHALDAAHKSYKGEYFSESKDFLQAYIRDVESIPETKKDSHIVKYLTQKDGGGQRETFASIFGLVTTGPENEEDQQELEQLFQNTISYMKDLLIEIGK